MPPEANSKGGPNINQSFFKRNLVAIVMIPAIIGIHYGWSILQDNEALVPKEERAGIPAVKATKYLWSKITGNISSETPKE